MSGCAASLLLIGGDFQSSIDRKAGGRESAGDENDLRRQVERRGLGRRGRGEMAKSRVSCHRRQLDVNVFGDAIGARESLQRWQLMLRQPLFRLQRGVLTHAALIGPQGDEQNRNFALR